MQLEPTIIPTEARSTIAEFCDEVCCGNAPAKLFCDLWFRYCHGIDDLIDTAKDGRPTMPHDKILELFLLANALYSCEFYSAFRVQLQPVVLLVTNAYADSLAWEKSDIHRRKTMADVLRCCGNEMFFCVAMICGGWAHVRSVSARLRERSWQLQHDEHDNPN